MRYKTKTVLAAGFVLAVGVAATAFGQSGSSNTPSAPSAPSAAQPDPGASVRQRPARPERAAAACGRATRRPRARRLVHGELEVQMRGDFATITADRGVITAVDAAAKSLTIKRADDKTVSVTASDATRICKDGKPATFGDLKNGDAAGIVQSDYDGKHVVRRIVALSANASPAAAAALAEDLVLDDAAA